MEIGYKRTIYFPSISKVHSKGEELDSYMNDLTLVIECIVKSRGIIPRLYLGLVATRNTGHSTSGGCAINVYEEHEVTRKTEKLTYQ